MGRLSPIRAIVATAIATYISGTELEPYVDDAYGMRGRGVYLVFEA